jgi:hypothetical protein
MKIRFHIDEDTGLPHVLGHGVSEAEAEEVICTPGDDRPARDGGRMALGQTRAGRYLVVIYVPDADEDEVFVVTAYPLKGKLLEAYKRRLRKRPQR